MDIVYMGTPDFAVKPLEALIEAGYNVKGAVTQPDKPVGRKAVLTPPPVKVCAEKKGIPVFQPNTLKNGAGTDILKELKPDIVVVIAYGKILPDDFLAFPKYGCINIHGSLLPKYRGAAPIQRSVLDGEEYSGITSMQLDSGIDTGDMLISRKLKILENETSGDLYERLAVLGSQVLLDTLKGIENNSLNPEKQDDSKSTYAAMLDKAMSHIDWQKSALEIHNTIRGLDPWPVASAVFDGKNLKLFRSFVSDGSSEQKPGTVSLTKSGMKVVCGDKKSVIITEVQYEGKKRMAAADFLRGHHVDENTVLE